MIDWLRRSQYKTNNRIANGSFGQIYLATHVITHEQVAIKFEEVVRTFRETTLSREAKILQLLGGANGFPTLKSFSNEGDYNVLIMTLLGQSLESKLQDCQGKFSLKTVLMLADQMISRLQFLHSKGIVHRDIKSENFTIGTGADSNIVYLIDFGLAKPFLNPATGERIQFSERKQFIGTSRFASIAAHMGQSQCPRDDLESLAYVLIYFLHGHLPWENTIAHDAYAKIGSIKKSVPISKLCENLPEEFAFFLQDVRSLRFDEVPPYAKYRAQFRNLFERLNLVYDNVYDWYSKSDIKNLLSSSPQTQIKRVSRVKILSPNQIPSHDPLVDNSADSVQLPGKKKMKIFAAKSECRLDQLLKTGITCSKPSNILERVVAVTNNPLMQQASRDRVYIRPNDSH